MGVKVRRHRGAWWIFVHHQGRRKSFKIGNKALADKKAREMEAAIAAEALHLPRDDECTVRQYAETWLSAAPLKDSTRRFYGDHLTNHIYGELGHVPIAAVDRGHVKQLVAAVTAKGLKPRTIAGIVRTLSTVLSEAVDDERLAANPALRPGRIARKLRDPNSLKAETVDPYTREEVERILQTAATHYPEWHAFVLCGFRTGLRLGELRALTWDALDWDHLYVLVRENYVEGQFTVPKSGLERRVDMSQQLCAVLQAWKVAQQAAWMARGRPLPDLVFPSDVETPLDDSRIRKAVTAIARAAKVRVRRQPVHIMRHTFASLLLQQGESVTYVKEQLGHASIAITVDTYGHLIPGGNRDAVDRLDSRPQAPLRRRTRR